MPLTEMTPMSVVPPPMSHTMQPQGFEISRPAPSAAATTVSIRQTLRAPAARSDSTTSLFSTSDTPEGTQTTTRGMKMRLPQTSRT